MKLKTFIINLDSRADRWEHIQKEAEKADLKHVERFPGVVPIVNHLLTTPCIDISKFYKFKSLGDVNSVKYCIGAAGCKLSHLNLLKRIKQKLHCFDYFLILEDDCVFDIENSTEFYNSVENSLQSIKENNIDFNILYLSCRFLDKDDFTTISPSLLKCNSNHGYTTHSYIINPKNIDKIISHIENSVVEIDNTYTTLDERYVAYPMLTYQLKNKSDILSHIHADEDNDYDYGEFHKHF